MSALDTLAPELRACSQRRRPGAPDPAQEAAPVPVMERAFETPAPQPTAAMTINQAAVVDAEFVPMATAALERARRRL